MVKILKLTKRVQTWSSLKALVARDTNMHRTWIWILYFLQNAMLRKNDQMEEIQEVEEESFRVKYFLVMIDVEINSSANRFDELKPLGGI